MRILLTGASRGIGRAIAERLAKPGAHLALCASVSSREHDEAVSVCRNRGAEVEGLVGDLRDPATPAALVEKAAASLGGLDAIISNAGIVAPGMLAELEDEAWDRIFSVNVRAPWMLARAAQPHLAASKGSFVAVASMSGVEPYPGTGAYSPSKAALIMLVRTLALEWAASGVRVNAVSPGLFLSAMTAPIYADPEKKAAREALIPMHRIGDPVRDLAGVVEFLISSDAGYLTGQNILVDGGLLGSIHSHIAGRPKSGGAA
ncbi:SDR family NAD(P)-dependent oxidoreductase [Bradyrhizobium canariense]|uniref:Glucose 1-dehydrogenase n=1 Tax=Bradyrhizobium canariense TaxID=255045 RepID=A0A1H1SHL3_9BRAD|nr:SDR family oxidoreductase [Bradyrhizobium canariense]SDS46839.1 glucose 1-dehydrogenase [Bradyrhizobium canariense]